MLCWEWGCEVGKGGEECCLPFSTHTPGPTGSNVALTALLLKVLVASSLLGSGLTIN